MKRFVEGQDRGQRTLFPECLENWIDENNPVRVIDAFVDGLDLADLGFIGVDPEATGRPSYHPSVLLKLYIYGYLHRMQSSRRLEREAGRNIEGHVAARPAHSRPQDDCGFSARKTELRFARFARSSSRFAASMPRKPMR